MTPQNNISLHHFSRTVMQVGLNPGSFYSDLYENSDKYLPPAYFIIICAVVNAILSSLLLPGSTTYTIILLFLNVIGMPILIACLLYGISFAMFRGVFTFQILFHIAAYANVTYLFSWIPGITWFASLWNFYLMGIGLSKAGKISGLKAFSCIIIVLVILVAILQILHPMIR
jgi:hypothetical protein